MFFAKLSMFFAKLDRDRATRGEDTSAAFAPLKVTLGSHVSSLTILAKVLPAVAIMGGWTVAASASGSSHTYTLDPALLVASQREQLIDQDAPASHLSSFINGRSVGFAPDGETATDPRAPADDRR